MALTRDEIAAAEKMHRFVRAYEKHRPSALRSMWIALPIALSSGTQMRHAGNHTFLYAYLGIWLAMMFVFFFMDRAQKARYGRERPVLAALERDHAGELPWIADERLEKEVEKHLADVRRIQQDLAPSHA